MLAQGCIDGCSHRQHLVAPDSHTAEVVSAGSNLHRVVPINGALQEFHIRCGMATPFYLDSKTTVFVSNDDKAVKKSVWLLRRAAVLSDGTAHNEIITLHVREYDMVADPFTKYLPYGTWRRLTHYLLNLVGDLPPAR